MRNKILLLLLTTLCYNSFAQIKFEKGYFIDNNGSTTSCLIKDMDWKNNPTQFEYKFAEGDKTIKITIESVKEFEISNISKYKRFSIDIDRSSSLMQDFSTKRAPQFIKETLFLKLLVEGEASLYLYKDRNLSRFFYHINKEDVRQLIFKEYITKNREVSANNSFKQQLLTSLKCDNIQFKNIKNLQYKKNDLIPFFITYNQCRNPDFVYSKKSAQKKFHLTIRPGLNFSSLSIVNKTIKYRNADFGSKVSARIGLEAEFILPFNNNKWAVIIEPNYQYFKTNTIYAAINYKSIEVPIGIRHYFFLNNKSKLFVNGLFVWDIAFNSTLDYGERFPSKIKPRNNFGFGIGYNYDKKFSLETRYTMNRDLFRNVTTDNTDYSTFSIILGYAIF